MMTEDQLEQETLIWLAELGYKVVNCSGLHLKMLRTAFNAL